MGTSETTKPDFFGPLARVSGYAVRCIGKLNSRSGGATPRTHSIHNGFGFGEFLGKRGLSGRLVRLAQQPNEKPMPVHGQAAQTNGSVDCYR